MMPLCSTKPVADPYLPPPDPSTFPAWEPRDFFRFEVIHQSAKSGSRARVGRLHTPHGVVDTPGYVPVATNGALKFMDHRAAAKDMGVQLMFANSYHLLLQPGPDAIAAAGGLHKFMNRDAPLITDSGGFQIFSLAYHTVADELKMEKGAAKQRAGFAPSVLSIEEEGVTFKSYRDGRRILLTPETTVDNQKAFGADIIIPLDDVPPSHLDDESLTKSVLRTHRWEARSLRRHLEVGLQGQAMYGVVHGGMNQSLRRQSAEYIGALPFDGYAIGGSLGKSRDDLADLLQFLMPLLQAHDAAPPAPHAKPTHLLGIADVESIHRAVRLGLDTFDSCFPTRNARHGSVLYRLPPPPLVHGGGAADAAAHRRPRSDGLEALYVGDGDEAGGGGYLGVFEHGIGKFNLKNAACAAAHDVPIDPQCSCSTCRTTSRAYLNHLIKANEPMASTYLTTHNMHFMGDFMAQVRAKIMRDEL